MARGSQLFRVKGMVSRLKAWSYNVHLFHAIVHERVETELMTHVVNFPLKISRSVAKT